MRSALLSLAFASVAILCPTVASAEVDVFLKSIVGEYDILEAGPVGGEMKIFHDYVGSVELDGGDMLFTFPYCPPKEGCLPGYAYFALNTVAPTRGDKNLTFKAVLDDGTVGTFHWKEMDGKIVYVNDQLEHSDGSKTAVEYHLRAR